MEIAVKDAARRLGVNEQRVRSLLAVGDLSGRRVGRSWLVDAEDVARLQQHHRPPGRPMGPLRAWGLLDILSGGKAAWLSPSARSQLRHSMARLAGADADQWRAVLRGRNEVRRCQVHPAAHRRLQGREGVMQGGAGLAARRGFDLVVSGSDVAQYYADPGQWPELARALAIREVDEKPNLLVLLPRAVWPFEDRAEVPDAVLAADLLDAAEPRAVRAGALRLEELLRGAQR
jgi:excisionase family DNA binding protein